MTCDNGTDSFGNGGRNNVHDVALVQVTLRVIKNGKGKAYLGVDYDGNVRRGDEDSDHGLSNREGAEPRTAG